MPRRWMLAAIWLHRLRSAASAKCVILRRMPSVGVADPCGHAAQHRGQQEIAHEALPRGELMAGRGRRRWAPGVLFLSTSLAGARNSSSAWLIPIMMLPPARRRCRLAPVRLLRGAASMRRRWFVWLTVGWIK